MEQDKSMRIFTKSDLKHPKAARNANILYAMISSQWHSEKRNIRYIWHFTKEGAKDYWNKNPLINERELESIIAIAQRKKNER